jgi:hypothetical protein
MPGRYLILLLPLLLLVACARTAAPPNFNGVWQVADPDAVVRPEVNATQVDYTPAAWARLQEFRSNWARENDDPAKYCVRQGMPNTMTTRARDYVFDIQQTAGRITVLAELFDNYRLIHLGQGDVPPAVNPSNNGYSIGRWDGSELHIRTTHLKARPEPSPVQRSAAASIDERWVLRQDPAHGEIIDIEMTITDPEVFVQPFVARQRLKRAAAGAVINEYACADALWEDYVARERESRR